MASRLLERSRKRPWPRLHPPYCKPRAGQCHKSSRQPQPQASAGRLHTAAASPAAHARACRLAAPSPCALPLAHAVAPAVVVVVTETLAIAMAMACSRESSSLLGCRGALAVPAARPPAAPAARPPAAPPAAVSCPMLPACAMQAQGPAYSLSACSCLMLTLAAAYAQAEAAASTVVRPAHRSPTACFTTFEVCVAAWLMALLLAITTDVAEPAGGRWAGALAICQVEALRVRQRSHGGRRLPRRAASSLSQNLTQEQRSLQASRGRT